MNDDYRSEEEKQRELEEFLQRFEDLDKKPESQTNSSPDEELDKAILAIQEEGDTFSGVLPSRTNRREKRESDVRTTKKQKKRKSKLRFNKKIILRNFLILFGALALIAVIWVGVTIIRAPHIDSDNLYSMLSENSTIYDKNGEIVETLYAEGSGLRTNISYTEMPEQLVDAFVAIEDKTFWEHSGFNFIRIFGAIFNSLTSGEDIKGTSTITQQLARNLYLGTERTLSRKVMEAYVAIQLERQLSKEQIVEAYLNTIYLGSNSNGVAAASETYFSKDVSELTLGECAVLASIPKSPTKYAPLTTLDKDSVTDPDSLDILLESGNYLICYQDNFSDRQHLVLKNMLEQDKISQTQYDKAMKEDIRDAIDPNLDPSANISSFFADYLVETVTNDLMDELHIDEAAAKDMIYTGGLQINSTLDLDAQEILENTFSKSSNFPGVTGYSKDKKGNILKNSGGILLYEYSNVLEDDGTFYLAKDEFRTHSDGSLTIVKNSRLNFYTTQVQGGTDISVELKSMYYKEDGLFYTVPGAYILIPSEYKSKDDDGNLVLSADFLEETDIFEPHGQGYLVGSEYVQIQQPTLQPQGAMVIMDYSTGGIIAMAGGRDINGKKMYNRATSPRQPGSSIKPLAVYGPALQSTADRIVSSDDEEDIEENEDGSENEERSGARVTGSGKIWTAATAIEDEPLTVNGKQWPKNWYSGYRGTFTLRHAVEQSVNTIAVRVLNNVGASTSVKYLKKMGISSVVESGDVNDMNPAALALGGMSNGISPLEMAAAYGTFPNEGVYTEPIAYTEVLDKDGNILLQKKAKTTKVFDKGVAYIMTSILRSVVTDGIAGSASFGGQPVAGKTGTTTDKYDIWFVGFTPYYSAALWVGNDMNIELSTGSGAAASLWSKVMRQIHDGMETGSYPSKPSNVISVGIDSVTGMLPNEETEADPEAYVMTEYFIRGTQPTSSSSGSRTSYTICSESGYLATPYCTQTETVAVRGSSADNEKYTCYCNLHNNDKVKYPIAEGLELDPNFDPTTVPASGTGTSTGTGTGTGTTGTGSTGTGGQTPLPSEIPDALPPGSGNESGGGVVREQ